MFIPREFDEWFWSNRFYHYQKVNKGVYCYVSPMLFGEWKIQLYLRRSVSLCELENRPGKLDEMIQLGNEWLEKYQDGDLEKIHQDFYSIWNPEGFWVKYGGKKHVEEI